MARTTTLPMRITYELGSDVLLATCEPPQDAVSEEKAPDLFLRLSHAVGEVIGFECLEFSRHARKMRLGSSPFRTWVRSWSMADPSLWRLFFTRPGRP